MPLPLAERDVTRQVRDFLGYRGWRAVRMQRTVVPGAFQAGEAGMADFLFLYYLDQKIPVGDWEPSNEGFALAVWVEFKRRGAKAAEHQKAWIERERIRGGTVVVVDDYDKFVDWYVEHFGWLTRGDLTACLIRGDKRAKPDDSGQRGWKGTMTSATKA